MPAEPARAAPHSVQRAPPLNVQNDKRGLNALILTTFSSLLRISQIEARDRTAGFRNTDLSEIVREVARLRREAASEIASDGRGRLEVLHRFTRAGKAGQETAMKTD